MLIGCVNINILNYIGRQMTSEELKKLTVAELKDMLTAQGLDSSGKKDELVARLVESNNQTSEVTDAIEEAAEAVVEKVIEEKPKSKNNKIVTWFNTVGKKLIKNENSTGSFLTRFAIDNNVLVTSDHKRLFAQKCMVYFRNFRYSDILAELQKIIK